MELRDFLAVGGSPSSSSMSLPLLSASHCRRRCRRLLPDHCWQSKGHSQSTTTNAFLFSPFDLAAALAATTRPFHKSSAFSIHTNATDCGSFNSRTTLVHGHLYDYSLSRLQELSSLNHWGFCAMVVWVFEDHKGLLVSWKNFLYVIHQDEY